MATTDELEKMEDVRRRAMFPKNWWDGWIVHHHIGPLVSLRSWECLKGKPWAAAERLLKEGFTLGVVVNPAEAVCVAAAVADRLPILVGYSEADMTLYIQLNFVRPKARKGRVQKATGTKK